MQGVYEHAADPCGARVPARRAGHGGHRARVIALARCPPCPARRAGSTTNRFQFVNPQQELEQTEHITSGALDAVQSMAKARACWRHAGCAVNCRRKHTAKTLDCLPLGGVRANERPQGTACHWQGATTFPRKHRKPSPNPATALCGAPCITGVSIRSRLPGKKSPPFETQQARWSLNPLGPPRHVPAWQNVRISVRPTFMDARVEG